MVDVEAIEWATNEVYDWIANDEVLYDRARTELSGILKSISVEDWVRGLPQGTFPGVNLDEVDYVELASYLEEL